MKSKTPICLIMAIIAMLTIAGCDSEGINRNYDDPLSQPQSDGAEPDANAGLGSPLDTPGPSHYVMLDMLNFEATLPSIVSVLFQSSDQYGNAIAGLETTDFSLLEDDSPVSHAETSLSIVPHEELPYSLQTVVMIDISSSIQPEDLTDIKDAVKALIMDDDGQSRLLPKQEIALYTFDDTVTLINDFSSNSQSIVDALNGIQPAIAITPTDLYGAIVTGTGRWTDSFDLSSITQGNLIIITDGTDTAARHTYQQAINTVANKSVYTLGVGNEISGQVLSAVGTSGSYSLRNFSQLNSALQSINQQVKNTANSFYYLHYASPKRRAEGSVANSNHTITLSVTNNANKSASGEISESFNSAEFTNVSAEVVISGPTQLELQESKTVRAHTRWGPSPATDYLWSIGEGNTSCAIGISGNNGILVTGVAEGSCTLQAQDLNAGDARAWHTISVISD